MAVDDAAVFDELRDRYRRIANLRQAANVLRFDREAWLPPNGEPARRAQLTTLEGRINELLAADELGVLLDHLTAADLDPTQTAVVREIRIERERETGVPDDLTEELEEARLVASEAYHEAWEASDIGPWAPHLTRIRDLHRQRAAVVDPDRDPYAVLYETTEPHLSFDTVDRLFDRVRAALVPLLEECIETTDPLGDGASHWSVTVTADDSDREPRIPADTFVEGIMRDVFDLLGFDWERGLFGPWGTPQSTGNQFDTRLKVMGDAVPLSLLPLAITGTVHELGHAFYDQGLPQEQYGTPLGEPRRGLHEGVARFWEVHVGRTTAFWERVLPIVADHVPNVPVLGEVTPAEVAASINAVRTENGRRVRADELTYQLHLLVRYDVERAFVGGAIAATEIPRLWNERMETYLGMQPENEREGCLQDGHWSYGFPAFVNYMTGSLFAAQLDRAVRTEVAVDACLRAGDLTPVHDWLTEHVYCHGRRYPTDELIERSTGDPLGAEAFFEHCRRKFVG